MLKTAATLAAAMIAFSGGTALAQQGENGERVNQVIVYGNQPCPEPRDENEIVVCVRQEDPYRIPNDLRQSDAPQNEAWSQKVAAYKDIGETGVGSCSTVGQAGQTGCTLDSIERAYAEKENADSVRFGQLIAEERARRLENIDENAASEQARVEQIEAEYNARINGQTAAQPEAEVVASE